MRARGNLSVAVGPRMLSSQGRVHRVQMVQMVQVVLQMLGGNRWGDNLAMVKPLSLCLHSLCTLTN